MQKWVVSSCTGTQRNETLTNCVTTPCMDVKTIGIPPCTGTPGQPPKMQVMLIILCWFNKLGTVFASKQSMWLDLSQLFVRESCHTYSSFIKIMDKQSVQDFHALVRYLNQFPPGEFLPTMSNFHLLVFLATSDMLPLEVMFMCWLRACDEITADKLQSDTLQPKSGFSTKLMNSKERLLIVLKKNPGLGC